MKEYIKKEIIPNRYEYGYNIQVMDINTMIKLGIKVPNKILNEYKKYENDLNKKIYFHNSIEFEFIKRQYYIRDYIEFSGMNSFELELEIKFYENKISRISKIIETVSNKDRLNDLETYLIILKNELEGLTFLKNQVEKKEEKLRVRK